MYDVNWARRVYEAFEEFNPRVKQIDMALCQLAHVKCHCNWLSDSTIFSALIDSIRGKVKPTIWNRYKRLVKRPDFDLDSAEALVYSIIEHSKDKRSEELQLYFNL